MSKTTYTVTWEHQYPAGREPETGEYASEAYDYVLARDVASRELAHAVAWAHRSSQYPEFFFDDRQKAPDGSETLTYLTPDAQDGYINYYIDTTDPTIVTDTHKTGAHGNE